MLSIAHLPQFAEPSLLIFKLPVFLIGILIHRAAYTPPPMRWPILCSIALATLQFHHYGYWSALILGLIGSIYIFWISPRPWRLVAVLDNHLSQFLSDTSYSVYLLHGVFLAIIGSRIDTYLHAHYWPQEQIVFVIWIAVVTTTYASAYVSYKCIERPGIRLGRIVQNYIGRATRRLPETTA